MTKQERRSPQFLHLQQPVPGWLEAVAILPPGAQVKAVAVQWLAEAKATNPNVRTVLRYVNDGMQQVNAGDTQEIRENRARAWFNAFLDDTFWNGSTAGVAHKDAVDGIGWWNEYYANSQSAAEKELWWRQERTAARIFQNEIRPRFGGRDVRLTIAAAPVGNDIPWQTAQTAVEYNCVVDYHAYDKFLAVDQRDPLSWQFHSGRWATMDDQFRALGFLVDWTWGEWGLYADPIVGNMAMTSSFDGFLAALRTNLMEFRATNAYQTGRAWSGPALFTTGGGDRWRQYNVDNRDHLVAIARLFQELWTPAEDPPPPEEDPMPRGAPRTQYVRTYNVIPDDATEEEAVAIFREGWRRSRETTGGSYDDAGVGDLDVRRANLYGKADERAIYESWYAEHYPGVQLAFPPVPGRVELLRATLCDVSRHNTPQTTTGAITGPIDFQRMASRGVAGCYIRGSIGYAGLDDAFATNWQAIRSTALKRGMYHLWRSDATAEQNLANMVRVVDRYGAGDLRIAVDVEPVTDIPRINGNEVARFFPLFRAQFGYEPLLYTGLWVQDRVDGDRSWFATSLLWLANYWPQPPQPGQYPALPAGATRDQLLMHQWTSSFYDGRTYGVASAGLDVNVAYDLNRLLV